MRVINLQGLGIELSPEEITLIMFSNTSNCLNASVTTKSEERDHKQYIIKKIINWTHVEHQISNIRMAKPWEKPVRNINATL